MYKQLVQPNLDVKANEGMCLAFVQSVYGAPVRYRSAWEAWNATEQKREGSIPNASVPVWFSHFGTYGNPPTYENWGHVVAHIPGYGYLSSPGEGYGSEVFPTIEAVEAKFNSKYVGWSLDINGLTVAEEIPDPTTKKETKMLICHTMDGRTPEQGPLYLLFGTDFYQGFGGEGKYFESQIGGQSMPVSREFMDSVRAFIDAGRK